MSAFRVIVQISKSSDPVLQAHNESSNFKLHHRRGFAIARTHVERDPRQWFGLYKKWPEGSHRLDPKSSFS